jgi:O-acetylhomoserine (thiol)-lyase
VERHEQNALKIVEYLSKHPQVETVNHPSLASHPDHEMYNKYFGNNSCGGAGSIFSIEIKGDLDQTKKFIDNLKLFSLLANVADSKSLVIHPKTTTHSQLSDSEAAEQGIKPNTIRLSIGTEHIDDLIGDLEQAFEIL